MRAMTSVAATGYVSAEHRDAFSLTSAAELDVDAQPRSVASS
jgi:hypothetical protein